MRPQKEMAKKGKTKGAYKDSSKNTQNITAPRAKAGGFALDILIFSTLILSIMAVYGGGLSSQFLNLDDDRYVYQNSMVTSGLTIPGMIWAFTSFHASNWHPLTWLSHMLDCQLYGLHPGLHHLTNLLLHMANALLLYLLLKRMTKSRWPSACVAALFALHPLHVESVSWVAERKDVLSAFFFMLTLWSYARYVEVSSRRRYALVFAMLAAGLMAKPMLVTVPLVLLLLDYWPLGRFRLDSEITFHGLRTSLLPLIREKLPLFALTVVSCAITFIAQQQGGSVQALEHLSLWSRIANSFAAYLDYIRMMIWPSELAVQYPYPIAGMLLGKAVLGFLLIALVTLFVAWLSRKNGLLATGWFWYVIMLVPVIGLIQVGGQAMADRYTYLPLIGLFLMISWGLGGLVSRWPSQRITICAISISSLLALGIAAHRQAGYWRDNITLYEHALAVTQDNSIVMTNLGSVLADGGRLDKAIELYERAERIHPESGRIQAALGTAYAKRGESEKAISHIKLAVSLDPNLSYAQNSMGVILLSQHKTDEATPFLRAAIRLDWNNADAHNNLGAALLFQGKIPEAIDEFKAALKIKPEFQGAQNNLKAALAGPSSGR
jgi:protein O-mannosyl-transferase